MCDGSILGHKHSQVNSHFGKIDKASSMLRFLMSKVAINLAQDF